MIDHVSIKVADLQASKAFYGQALEPLDYAILHDFEDAIGFGVDDPDFWIVTDTPSGPVHVAFTSPDRETVRRFHAAALAAGGRDNGQPGLRLQYHDHYYAAFVLDPDGNNVEAVCHAPEKGRGDASEGDGGGDS